MALLLQRGIIMPASERCCQDFTGRKSNSCCRRPWREVRRSGGPPTAVCSARRAARIDKMTATTAESTGRNIARAGRSRTRTAAAPWLCRYDSWAPAAAAVAVAASAPTGTAPRRAGALGAGVTATPVAGSAAAVITTQTAAPGHAAQPVAAVAASVAHGSPSAGIKPFIDQRRMTAAAAGAVRRY